MAVAAGIALALVAARATGATDPRELKAREDFAAGRYQQALELFAKLYAESLHPNYLRNIGRCYQNLGDPDRAITSFNDYLRTARAISGDERHQIEGFIAEMEQLKRQRASAAQQATAPPAASSSAPIAPLPAASPPPPAPGAAPVVISSPAESPPSASPSAFGRWWFWALVGGAVAIGLGAAAAGGAFTSTQEPSCPVGFKC